MALKQLTISLLLCIVIGLPLMGVIPVKANGAGPGDVTPLESVGDCTPYAQYPKVSGSTVTGSGGDTCVMVHPYIRIVVTVYDVTAGQRSLQGINSCRNVTACSATSGTVPYVSGHRYRTEVSAYFNSFNQYAASVDVTL